jgi:hypothetical protein
MTVKLIRMSTGEDVVATVVNDHERDTIHIKDAIVAVPAGGNQLAFAPWSPILKKDVEHIKVYRRFVMYISEVDESVLSQYNTLFNKVIVPEKKLVL